MPDGTVTGTFRLNTPASRQLRDMRAEGKATDSTLKQLGRTMDTRIGGRVAEQRLERYSKRLGDMRRTSTRTHDSMRIEWASTTRVVTMETRKQGRRIDELELRLDDLGRKRSTPQIDLDGVAAANLQLTELEARLRRLGAMRATPNVGIGGGFRGGAGAGGGGGAGPGRRRFGLPSFMTGLAARAAPLVLPAATSLVGGGGALLGSAGQAALGAGALGFPALGGLAAGGLGTFASARPVIKGLQTVTKSQTAYNKAIQDYGKDSKQAQAAADKYHSVLRQEPKAIRGVMDDLQKLRGRWRGMTGPARESFAQTLGVGIGTARGLAPNAARATNRVAGANLREARGFRHFATGGVSSPVTRGIDESAAIYDENLRALRRTGQNLITTFVNIERAARPFFREGTDWLQHWTRGWADSTADITKTRGTIGRMVDHLRDWKRLGGAAFRLTKDLLSAGSRPGQSMVERLTHTLDRWDRWTKRHPAEVRQFFQRAVNSVEHMATALGKILSTLGKLGDALTPLLDRFSTLAGLVGGLGLLTPGVGALALGAYRGGRGALGGPGAAGGGAGGAGALAAGVALGGAGGRGGLRGALGSPLAGYRNFRQYGRMAGLAGAAGEVRAGGGMLARGIVGGALRRYLPIAGAFSLLDAAGFQGSLQDKAQAGLSTFTLGAVGRPTTTAQARDTGRGRAENYLSLLSQDPGRAAGAIQRRIGKLTGSSRWIPKGGFLGMPLPIGPSQHEAVSGLSGLRTAAGRGDSAAKRDLAEYNALNKALRQTQRLQRDIQRDQQRTRADKVFTDIGKAYDTLNRKFGGRRARHDWTQAVQQNIKRLGPTGRIQLAKDGAQWIKQMRESGQLTARQAERMNNAIVHQFRKMGKRVSIVNGQILVGTQSEWTRISNALTSRAELAREEVEKSFTRIQLKAIGSLTSFGFSGSEAKKIVRATERANIADVRAGIDPQRERQREAQAGRAPGHSGPRGAPGVGTGLSGNLARGGQMGAGGPHAFRVRGFGATDNQTAPGGGRWAPGEMVVNRHSEAKADRELGGPGRLWDIVRHEGKPNWLGMRRAGSFSGAFQRGGVGAAIAGAGRGRAGGGSVTGDVVGLKRPFLTALQHLSSGTGTGISVTSGYRSDAEQSRLFAAHPDPRMVAPPGRSHHRLGIAADIAPSKPAYHGAEGRYNLTFPMSWEPWHIELVGGARGGTVGAGAGGAGAAPQQIHLKAPRSKLGGVPGALSTRAGQIYAAGLEKHVNAKLRTMSGGGGDLSGFSGGGNAQANQRLGRRMMIAAGWPASEWPALRQLWTHESGWNAAARNPSSGAQGIPQALGHGDIGSDAASQIRWGLNYIRGRYGSPSKAWSFWQGHNWYSRGGRLADWAGHRRTAGSFTTRSGRPAHFIAGEGGRREDVSIRPHRPRRRSALGSSASVGGVKVDVNFNGPVHVATKGDLDKLAKTVSEAAGKKVLAALGGAAADEELIG